jgi:hypothetical protein
MLRELSKRLVSFFLALAILAPFPYILVIPEYAFAETAPAGGSGSTNINSWGQAAASGAVSLGACLTAGGLTVSGLFSGVTSFLGSISDSIFGSAGSAAGSALSSVGSGSPAGDLGGIAGGNVGPLTSAGGVPGLSPVPVKDDKVKSEVEKSNEKLDAANKRLDRVINLQLGRAMKQDVFDCIAWAIAKMIWRHIAASVIDWINSGFNGKPAFIQNFDRFMLGIADSVAGEIIQGAGLGFLCSPFQLNIRIALAARYAQRAPSCTLTQVIANIDNFMKSFQDGGWSSWLQFTTMPQNNAFGGYLLGEATIAIRTQDAKTGQAQQLSWGSGFLSLTQQTCKQVPVSVNGMRPQMVEQCSSSIQTPGELIAHKLGSTIDAPELSLLMANEMNQIIDALSQQLITQALNGLFKLSQPSSYGDDYYRFSTPTAELAFQDSTDPYTPTAPVAGVDALVTQAGTQIDIERQLQDRLGQTLALFDNAIDNERVVLACWSDKASATSTASLSSSERQQAGIQAQQFAVTIQGLNSRRAPYLNAYNESTSTVAYLQDLSYQASSVPDAQTLAGLSQDFFTKKANGSFANQSQVDQLDVRILTLRTEASTIYQNAQLDLDLCRYYPDAVPSNSQ